MKVTATAIMLALALVVLVVIRAAAVYCCNHSVHAVFAAAICVARGLCS